MVNSFKFSFLLKTILLMSCIQFDLYTESALLLIFG